MARRSLLSQVLVKSYSTTTLMVPQAILCRPTVWSSSRRLAPPAIVSSARALHDQHGLNINQNRRSGAQSRGKVIGRLDRILNSTKAQESLSVKELVHIQYLRDFWADRDYDQGTTSKDMRQLDTMTHETNEVLRRYSAQVDHGSTVISTNAPIHVPEDTEHRKMLAWVEERFGESGRVIARQILPFRRQLLAWAAAICLTVPLLFLFEGILMMLFPERVKVLEENEQKRHQMRQYLPYEAGGTSQSRRSQ